MKKFNHHQKSATFWWLCTFLYNTYLLCVIWDVWWMWRFKYLYLIYLRTYCRYVINGMFNYHLCIIIGLWRCVATRVAYVDGRVAGDERKPAAGRNRGLGLWRASHIAMSRQRCGLRGRTGGYKQSRRRAAWRLVVYNIICCCDTTWVTLKYDKTDR